MQEKLKTPESVLSRSDVTIQQINRCDLELMAARAGKAPFGKLCASQRFNADTCEWEKIAWLDVIMWWLRGYTIMTAKYTVELRRGYWYKVSLSETERERLKFHP